MLIEGVADPSFLACLKLYRARLVEGISEKAESEGAIEWETLVKAESNLRFYLLMGSTCSPKFIFTILVWVCFFFSELCFSRSS